MFFEAPESICFDGACSRENIENGEGFESDIAGRPTS